MSGSTFMRRAGLVLASLAILAAVQPAQSALPPSPIVDWLNTLQQWVRETQLPNQLAGRVYGLLGLSIYNALVANLDEVTNKPKYNETAVAAVAAHTLLTHWYPGKYAVHDTLIKRQLTGLDAVQLAAAQELGEAAANAVTATRTADGFATWPNFTAFPANTTASIGRYQLAPNQTTFVYPQIGYIQPLLLTKGQVGVINNKYKQKFAGYFRSPEYYDDLRYTASIGGKNNTNITTYDAQTPPFWAGGAGTHTIGGHFLNISYQVLPRELDLLQQAHFFARFGAAIADAAIACYRVKYEVLFWRPVTAIRLPDGSEGEYTPDPTWTTNINTPNHPSYPSGHQCTSGAAIGILRAYVGDEVPISIGSEGIAAAGLRNFTSLSQVLEDASASRIIGGVHFRRENADGAELGLDVAQLVLSKL